MAQARQAIADAVGAVGDYTAYVRPPKNPRPLDAWVIVNRVEPWDFRACMATFTVAILLSTDEVVAEDLYESDAVDLIDAVTALNVTDVALEAISLAVGTNAAPMYALTLTLSMEVS